ncbi:MAG: hypothetical protein Q4E65_04555 [Clostridia bacterium]|nr:hypothetical protein [Clostridia bacterium]
MRKVLEDLYLGNIVPNEKVFVRGTPFAKALATIEKNETYLNTTLEGKDKDAFAAFVDAQSELNAITGREGFVDGFRLGMRVALAALSDEDSELMALV